MTEREAVAKALEKLAEGLAEGWAGMPYAAAAKEVYKIAAELREEEAEHSVADEAGPRECSNCRRKDWNKSVMPCWGCLRKQTRPILYSWMRDHWEEGKEPEPDEPEPIEVGQVWATAEYVEGGPHWTTHFAIGVTRVLDEWIYFRPLRIKATEDRCTKHDFPILYVRLPYRAEEATP